MENFHIGYLIRRVQSLMIGRAKRKTLELPVYQNSKLKAMPHFLMDYRDQWTIHDLKNARILISLISFQLTLLACAEPRWLIIKLTCSGYSCSYSSRCDLIIRVNQCIFWHLVLDTNLYIPLLYFSFTSGVVGKDHQMFTFSQNDQQYVFTVTPGDSINSLLLFHNPVFRDLIIFPFYRLYITLMMSYLLDLMSRA